MNKQYSGPGGLRKSDVVFMYKARDLAEYEAYGGTMLAWGGLLEPQKIAELHRLKLHVAGSMWCLTAGDWLLAERPDLAQAVVRDISGAPIEVPWLPEGRLRGTPTWWGCFNHPVFRDHLQKQAWAIGRSGADGLHVDDHLGTAHPGISYGGCFCDYCMEAFRRALSKADQARLRELGYQSLDKFDYRELVRRYAASREDYLARQQDIPLHRRFVDFLLRRARSNLRRLHRLAMRAARRPLTLSANAGIHWPAHLLAAPELTYLVCEVEHHVHDGVAGAARAQVAFRLADTIGKNLAATANGTDWAFVKTHGTVNIVRHWIAQAYACGHTLMTPARAWCYYPEKGTDYYFGAAADYAPLYRFARSHAALLDDARPAGAAVLVLCSPPHELHGNRRVLKFLFRLAAAGIPFEVAFLPNSWRLGGACRELPGRCRKFSRIVFDPCHDAAEPPAARRLLEELAAEHPGATPLPDAADGVATAALVESLRLLPAPVRSLGGEALWALPRLRPGAPPVIHLLNRDYAPATDAFTPLRNLEIAVAPSLARACTRALLHLPDAAPADLPTSKTPKQALHIHIPELPFWGIIELT